MFKRCQVIILPTQEVSKLYLFQNTLEYDISCIRTAVGDIKKQNLYILSDEEVKEGDWYCSPGGILSQYNGKEILPEGWNKIIASTDKSLTLPQPSESFIKAYIEAYNSGNSIVDINVEYEEIKEKKNMPKYHKCNGIPTTYECRLNYRQLYDINNKPDCSYPKCDCQCKEEKLFNTLNPEYKDFTIISQLKVDKNNTITIRKIKDSYTREEVKALIEKYDSFRSAIVYSSDTLNNWINKNL